MTASVPSFKPPVLAAIAAWLSLCCVTTATAAAVSPLPSSDYAVHALCSAPTVGHAGCMAAELVPLTAEASAHKHPLGVARSGPAVAETPANGYFGMRPKDLHSAYELPTTAESTQTIALVDAYNDPTAEADLKAYSLEFKLPECTAESKCFEQVNETGSSEQKDLPFPQTTSTLKEAFESSATTTKAEAEEAYGWGVEISLDIETAHATCQSCHILLVEANSTQYSDLEAAEREAAALGATEISNSWGGPELGETQQSEAASPFDHAGIVITASAGDNGYLNWASSNAPEEHEANFPASSPHVVAVGGTRLELEASGSWGAESVWNGDGAGGGGCSNVFTAPAWQQEVLGWSAVGCGKHRAVADVAADADPYTGLAVRDSSPGDKSSEECKGTSKSPHWCTIGGTSLASPLIASVFALAGGAGGVEYPARTLYENEAKEPAALHDITVGSNGECTKPFEEATGLSGCEPSEEAEASNCVGQAICLAGSGYDGPTGVGTPKGIKAFTPTGNDAGGGGTSGGGGATGEQPPTTASGSSSGGGAAPASAPIPTPTVAASPPVQLTALALTLKAIVALDNGRPKIAQIGFAFTINASVPVRLTLTKRIRFHRHARWQAVGRSATGYARIGRDTWSLRGRGSLGVGLYKITLTPAHASARSLTFQIG